MHVPVLFVIPARAGSKGVPGKNYREIDGKPLTWWTIEAARRFSHRSEIAVSTNDSEIVRIAEGFNRDHGDDTVRIIERPEELCGDSSTTEDAMAHTIEEVSRLDISFRYISLLQPTSPARPNRLIDRCYKRITEYGASSLMTVSEHTPFFWQYDDGGARCKYSGKRKMRQDLERYEMCYHDNGNLYIIEADKFSSNGRITDRPLLEQCSQFESMQIDTEDDFALMEMAAKHYGGFL